MGLRLLYKPGFVRSDGREGGGGGAGLLIGACRDLLDPHKWGHPSVGVLCPPLSRLASLLMRALYSPGLPSRQDLTSEPFHAPASVSASQAENPGLSTPPGEAAPSRVAWRSLALCWTLRALRRAQGLGERPGSGGGSAVSFLRLHHKAMGVAPKSFSPKGFGE